MRRLVLVKHALPEIVPDRPPSQWRLGATGHQRSAALAELLASYTPAVIASSVEPKARETAEIVADRLAMPVAIVEGLHEHERSKAAFRSTADFEAEVATLFARPGELVMGDETADQARERFARAVTGVIEQHPDGDLIVVAHGTVITLFVAAVAGVAPFPFWKRLGLPSFVVLGLPEFELLEVVEDVERDQ